MFFLSFSKLKIQVKVLLFQSLINYKVKSLNINSFDLLQVAAENSAGIGVFSDPFLFQTAESGNYPKLFMLN